MQTDAPRLDVALAERMAAVTLGHLGRPYPHMLVRWLEGPDDLAAPPAIHPLFHGSFDWNSRVHGWWQVVRLLRLFPGLGQGAALRARLAETFTSQAVAGEIAVFTRPGGTVFERPYGWAWLLALHGELIRAGHGDVADRLDPLARLLAARLDAYFHKLAWPVRHGNHGNTAFAMILALEWARCHDGGLARTIATRARAWFMAERPAPWLEPGGEDFLSPTLCVAVLMLRVLGRDEARAWLAAWHDGTDLAALAQPLAVADRSDPRIAHLDGLNLSRAWCWGILARQMGETARAAAARHLDASLPHITGDYMGEHWLATFALLACTAQAAA